jgi:hypothetical protein
MMTRRHFSFFEMVFYGHVQVLTEEGDIAGLMALERFAEVLCVWPSSCKTHGSAAQPSRCIAGSAILGTGVDSY